MPQHGETFGSFAATHEDRLVRSLMSETGLPHAAAARVAADVLPVAYERRFATCGAAYGWLRVAARHHAAGSPTWSDAADTALGCADSALSVLAALPAADRELLRLRYVDGLRPETLAARLGVGVDDVVARLDRAQAAAASALPAPRPPADPKAEPARRVPAVSVPRLAAAVAAVAAALVATGGHAPPAVPPVASDTLPAFNLPGPGTGTGGDPAGPVPASERRGQLVVVPASAGRPGTTLTPPGGHPQRPPSGTRCRHSCGNVRLNDELHVRVPKDVSERLGQEEVVIKQDVGSEHVHICDVLDPLPREHADCRRGNT